MPQKDLERRILALALAEGLLRTPPGAHKLDAPTSDAPWGGSLQRMLDEGSLRTEDLDRLLWRAVQQDPEGLPACPESWTLAPGPAAVDASQPERIGPYGDLSLIGVGGHGRVFRAFDSRLQRWVALKLIRSGGAELHLEEARAQARVEHPNICKVYEVGEAQGQPFIALQLVAGRTLADFPMVRDAAVAALRDVAEALHAAHRKGLVHLDVKPANILVEVSDQGQVHPLVTDFGLVALKERGGRPPSGTPPFAAPEQMDANAPPPDRRADIYGCGVTLYTLLARALPYAEREPAALLAAIRSRPAPALESLGKDIPGDLSRIVAKAMADDPQDRYSTALAMAEDLQRFLDGESVLAAPATVPERLARWRRRNPATARIVLGASAAVLLAALFGIGSLWRARSESGAIAQIGAEATQMEDLLRMAYLAPPHDLRPQRARIRQRMDSLRARARGFSLGPAAFALGKGHALLGQLEEARRELERARSRGFRSAQLNLALGQVLGDLYHEGLARANRIPDPVRREARRAELAQEYRAPAQSCLREATRGGVSLPEPMEAALALMEGRLDAALASAQRARTQDPTLFEAWRLEARTWMERAGLPDTPRTQALAAFAQAEAALLRAAEIARSDIHTQVDLASCRLAMAEAHFNSGQPSGPALAQAQEAIQAALALDPGDPEALLVKAGILSFLGNDLDLRGQDPRAACEEAVALARKVEGHSELRWRIAAQLRIAQACHFRKYFLIARGDPAAEANLRMGAEAAGRAGELDPRNGAPMVSKAIFLVDLVWFRRRAGEDPMPLLDSARQAAEAAVAVGDGPFRSHQALGLVWQGIAEERWGKNQNPEEAFAKAATHLGKALESDPANLLLLNVIARNEYEWAEFRKGVGLDPGAHPAQGLAAVAKVLERLPEDGDGNRHLARLALLEAEGRVQKGQDPGEAVAQADRAVRRSLARYRRDPGILPGLHCVLGHLEAVRARWALVRSLPPQAFIARAKTEYRQALAIDRANPEALEFLARIHLLECAWKRTRKEAVGPLLAEALKVVDQGLGQLPGQEVWYALKARLLLAAESAPGPAGARLREEAAALVRKARELNPESVDTKEAAQALARAGT